MHKYTYNTYVFQDLGPPGTVKKTVPTVLSPGPDQLNQRYKHMMGLFAASIVRVLSR